MEFFTETPTTETKKFRNKQQQKSLNDISKAIDIPSKNILCKEYSLTKNFFDPNECSPPNNWNNRLIKRMNSYFTEDKILCSR